LTRALARYMDGKDTALEQLMGGGRPVREKVQMLLAQAIDLPAGDPAGRLVVNSMVEMALCGQAGWASRPSPRSSPAASTSAS
jgi:hypothetical protein